VGCGCGSGRAGGGGGCIGLHIVGEHCAEVIEGRAEAARKQKRKIQKLVPYYMYSMKSVHYKASTLSL
jgi:hypothetical protein